MTRTMTSMLLVLSCLFAGGVRAQGVREHPQPSTVTTSGAEVSAGTTANVSAPNSPEPDQNVTQEGQDRLQNILNRRRGLPQSALKIRGTWTFTGDLLQTTCPGEVDQQRVSHTFTLEQNEDVLYVTSGAGIEFFGDLGTDGEFALATSTSTSPVSPACTQAATLLLSGNVHHRRANFSIVNEFVGDCPATDSCESVYDGTFTKVKTKDEIN
jgi:hypothetical protein